ncbi:hypothetical protein [Acidithiobacillus sp.]
MWLNLLAQPAACGTGPALKCYALGRSPTDIARGWREQGWFRQIKVYRLHRHCKGWQTTSWLSVVSQIDGSLVKLYEGQTAA